MHVHFPYVRVAVFFGIQFRTTEKVGQESELLDPRMGNTHSSEMQHFEIGALGLELDDVIKSLD
jgi:hypothetical protein